MIFEGLKDTDLLEITGAVQAAPRRRALRRLWRRQGYLLLIALGFGLYVGSVAAAIVVGLGW